MKMGFKQQLWMSFSIVFGVIIISSVGLYFLENELHVQAVQIVADKTLAAQQNSAVSILANLKDNAAQAAPYLAAMNQLLPSHDALIGFPQWITSVGQGDGVSVSAAFQGNGTPATAAVPGTDNFSFTASGPAGSLAAFLDDLEVKKPGFLVAIDSFDLLDSGGTYQLSGQGRVFSR